MASAELSPEERKAELESRLLDLLDEYGDDATKFVKKGIRRKQVERARDTVRLEYVIVKDMISVFYGTSGQVSRSDAELIVATLYPDLRQEEVSFHGYEVLQEMERDGDIVYVGSHYKTPQWLAGQQFTDEFLSRNPYLVDKARRTEQEAARLAQLASRNADGFTPAKESVGRLGHLASGQVMPDSQS